MSTVTRECISLITQPFLNYAECRSIVWIISLLWERVAQLVDVSDPWSKGPGFVVIRRCLWEASQPAQASLFNGPRWPRLEINKTLKNPMYGNKESPVVYALALVPFQSPSASATSPLQSPILASASSAGGRLASSLRSGVQNMFGMIKKKTTTTTSSSASSSWSWSWSAFCQLLPAMCM